jgi:hypothetical protein
MKYLNIFNVLGFFALVVALAAALKWPSDPPRRHALERKEARLTLAQPGPVSFAAPRGRTTLGSLPGMWVLGIEIGDDEQHIAIDPPEEPRRERLKHLERNSPVVALVTGREIWHLETTSGELLVDYGERAAEAELSKEGHLRFLAMVLAIAFGLIALGQLFNWAKRRLSQPARAR